MAVTTQINTVSITLSDGYEMTVLTNETNVEEILKDNNILIQENERVISNLDEDSADNKYIEITNKTEQEIEIAEVSESGIETTLESLLETYSDIVEKIEVEEEEIPFETVTKNVANSATKTKNKVLQKGENGIKKVTYKVKYQNDEEIERTKISEEVIKEPKDKIVQVQAVTTTSRSETTRSSSSSSSSSSVKIYKVTAYCSCSKCCGKSTGYTASGTKATAGRTVAAPSSFSFGTKLSINGKTYVVEDRGGAISGNKIDIYFNSHSEAVAWGVKYLPVEVIE